MGQSSPNSSLRAGRAGEGEETCSGQGASVRKAPGQYTSPPGPELEALKSGAPQRGPENSPAQQGRLLSRMVFQSSAHECILRLGGCSCTCRLWQHVKRTCSQLGLGSAPVGRKAALRPMSGPWRVCLGPTQVSSVK